MENRLQSLDFFRGLTMFLLIGESTHLYAHLLDPAFRGTIVEAIGNAERLLALAHRIRPESAYPAPARTRASSWRALRVGA